MESGKVCRLELDDGIGAAADPWILFHSALYCYFAYIATTPSAIFFAFVLVFVLLGSSFLASRDTVQCLRAAGSPHENHECLTLCVRSLSVLLHPRPVSVMSQRKSISMVNSQTKPVKPSSESCESPESIE